MALHVLLLDADPATTRALSTLGASRGWNLTSTADPEDAIRLANRLIPDLLVVDATTPSLRGVDFVRVLRTRPATALIPALFMGEPAALERRISGFRLGADGFLPKPLDASQAELAAHRALRERSKAEQAVRPSAGGSSSDFSVAPSQTAFRGKLEDVGLPTLLTLLEMERKTGTVVLILDPEGEKVRLFVRKGRLLRAAFDARPSPTDAELVYELVGRTSGRFDFRAGEVDGEDRIRTPLPTLLLEGARRLDEARKA